MTEPPSIIRRSPPAGQPDVRIEQADVQVNEAPIEVHEHINVDEPPATSAPARAAPVAPTPERVVRIEERDADQELVEGRRWRTYVTTRRERRFAGAGLALALLTVVAAGWLMDSAVRGEGLPAGLAPDEAIVTLMLLLVVGLAVASAAADGIVVALVLGFLLGLAALLYGVYEFATGGLSSTGQVLNLAMAGLGVVVLAASTLGLGSWRGRRHEERIYVQERRRGPTY